MFKFIYRVFHEYSDKKTEFGESLFNSIELGYFTSKKKVKYIIQKYKDLEGFRDHNEKCFKIKRFLLNIKRDNNIIYELYHSYIDENGYEEYEYLGIFASKESAEKKRKKLIKSKEIFQKYVDGFDISEEILDSENIIWNEGFNRF